MADKQNEIRFGIGTMLAEGKPATAVVVEGQVAKLANIVARYSTQPRRLPIEIELTR